VRIKATFPGRTMKFLVVLREPVDRIVSNWKHVLAHAPVHTAAGRTGHWTIKISEKTFEERLEAAMKAFTACVSVVEATSDYSPSSVWRHCNMRADHHSMVTRSLYDLQLKYWLSFFPKDSFCIISSNILRDDTRGVLARVERFIGVPVQKQNTDEGEGMPNNRSSFWMDKALRNTGGHSNPEGGWQPDMAMVERLKSFVRKYGNETFDFLANGDGYLGC